MSSDGVNADDLYKFMWELCHLRAMWVIQSRDPWAFRQGLVLALAVDTAAARQKGVPESQLAEFDAAIKLNVAQLVKEWGDQV